MTDSGVALPETDRPLVFVSCGQYTQSEKTIGAKICEIIRTHTEYEPYFAEMQRSFEGLSNSILAALHRMSGMVVIMHKRGLVTTPNGTFQRGSVWIEQEIAIAAALQHAGRKIEVVAYVEDGIKREGLRDLLHLNPVTFLDDADIERDFEALVKRGEFMLQPAEAPMSPYDEEIAETLGHAAGQGGLMIFTYVLSMTIAVHPTKYIAERFSDDALPGVIERARTASGVGFPIGPPSAGRNRADGFAVTTYPTADGPWQHREYYRVRRDGLFVATQVSPDDIKEDRQYRESDRYVGFSTLVATLTRMGSFAASYAAVLGVETKATLRISGLANHRLIDDTAERMLVLGETPVSHEDSVEESITADPERLAGEHRDWSARVATECLRLLNYPATTAHIEKVVKTFQERVR